MKKALIIILITVLVFSAGFAGYLIYDNSRVVDTEYTISSERLPESFDGFKISVISDFHNGSNYKKVLARTEEERPDIICITGDLISQRSDDLTNTKRLIRGLTKIAPIYYVYGNHEYYHATQHHLEKPILEEALSEFDIRFLNADGTTIMRGGEQIYIVGLRDSIYDDQTGRFEGDVEPFLQTMDNILDKSVFSILLAHRPQYMDLYAKYGYDLILSGHLHGGQINIKPIRDRILRSRTGTDMFSKGKYELFNSTMIVSAGTTNQALRVFNTPEVVTVTLKSEKKSEK